MKNETNNSDTKEIHGNANETDNSNLYKELREDVELHGTPFIARRYDDKWMITIGQYQIAKDIKDLKQCEIEAGIITWEKITTTIGAIAEQIAKETINHRLERITKYEKEVQKEAENKLNEQAYKTTGERLK